jgi:uncharacterized protein (DUF2235 family)
MPCRENRLECLIDVTYTVQQNSENNDKQNHQQAGRRRASYVTQICRQETEDDKK